jgi:hypothetical protein
VIVDFEVVNRRMEEEKIVGREGPAFMKCCCASIGSGFFQLASRSERKARPKITLTLSVIRQSYTSSESDAVYHAVTQTRFTLWEPAHDSGLLGCCAAATVGIFGPA